MDEDDIRDIPQVQELLEDAEMFAQLKEQLPLLRPMLEQTGVDVDGLEAMLEEEGISELIDETRTLAGIPDRFNELFAERGWIFYESFDFEVAQEAIELAESGDMEAAEMTLVSFYDPERIEKRLLVLGQINEFRPRIDLAEKALVDYEAGRYHACVPVVLSLIDGFVQDVYVSVHGETLDFSSREATFEAWDSMAAHPTGLEKLRGTFLKGRKKTRTEEISVPYRHGIMHGMDLGYDTKLVAAKTWATLFAVREWAIKAKEGELEPPEDEEERSLADVVEQEQRIQRISQRGEEWGPRGLVVGDDIPETGLPEDYPDGTPERAFVEFLMLWKQRNYGGMANELITRDGTTENPGKIRDQFTNLDLKSFRLVEVTDSSIVFTDVTVELELEHSTGPVTKTKKVRVGNRQEDGESAILEDEKGTWTITNPIQFLAPE